MDNAEHAVFVCAKWGVAWEAVGQAVGTVRTPETMVSLMLKFLVLTGMPSLVLGESCTTSIKDSAIFPPHQNKKKEKQST